MSRRSHQLLLGLAALLLLPLGAALLGGPVRLDGDPGGAIQAAEVGVSLVPLLPAGEELEDDFDDVVLHHFILHSSAPSFHPAPPQGALSSLLWIERLHRPPIG